MINRINIIYILFLLGIIFLLLSKVSTIPLFYGVMVMLFFAFSILVVYSTMEYIISKEPDNLWEIGFIGLFGLIGLIPFFPASFFGFFGFFAYFGLKN